MHQIAIVLTGYVALYFFVVGIALVIQFGGWLWHLRLLIPSVRNRHSRRIEALLKNFRLPR